jgi:hypothetical protein
MIFLMMSTWCSKHVEDTKNLIKTLISKSVRFVGLHYIRKFVCIGVDVFCISMVINVIMSIVTKCSLVIWITTYCVRCCLRYVGITKKIFKILACDYWLWFQKKRPCEWILSYCFMDITELSVRSLLNSTVTNRAGWFESAGFDLVLLHQFIRNACTSELM